MAGSGWAPLAMFGAIRWVARKRVAVRRYRRPRPEDAKPRPWPRHAQRRCESGLLRLDARVSLPRLRPQFAVPPSRCESEIGSRIWCRDRHRPILRAISTLGCADCPRRLSGTLAAGPGFGGAGPIASHSRGRDRNGWPPDGGSLPWPSVRGRGIALTSTESGTRVCLAAVLRARAPKRWPARSRSQGI